LEIKENVSMNEQKQNLKQKIGSKDGRSNLGVAKSLHVAKNTLNNKQKYDWLFNDGDDETPRDTGISHRNLIKRVGDDQTTNTNTGTKNDENLTDTM
jgi:hypothetical protein